MPLVRPSPPSRPPSHSSSLNEPLLARASLVENDGRSTIEVLYRSRTAAAAGVVVVVVIIMIIIRVVYQRVLKRIRHLQRRYHLVENILVVIPY